MLDIEQIISFYPGYLKSFRRNLLCEYMQHKILEIIFDSEFGGKLVFMGGTATHIVYQNNRFSEDLDFDNLGLNSKDFKQLTKHVQRKLELEGYTTEIKNIYRNTYRCYLKIPNILFESGLTGHREEKMLIQIDTEPQKFSYQPEKFIINKFDVFCQINITPQDILLSQKIYALLKRKRPLGRDIYDAIFLFGKTNPNFVYLQEKLNIKNMEELKRGLSLKCKHWNFKQLAKDVEPFLFTSEDSKKILLFPEYLEIK